MSQPLRFVRKVTLPMPAAAFFEAGSNTDRVERAAWLPAAHFQMGREPGGRQALRADARLFGIPVHWYELPFEWVTGRYWRVHRIFEGVPLRWITITTTLQPLGPAGTRVNLQVEVLPSNLLGTLVAFLVFGVAVLTRMEHVYREMAKRYRAHDPVVVPIPLRPDLHEHALEARARDLRARALPPGLADRLIDHLATAPDDEVTRMRPFALAGRWGTDRLATLRTFLYATQAGLLDLHWDVLCPNCRVAKATIANLADLALEAHCDTCNIRYDVNFDEYVELRFTVNAAVREVYDATYCIGGPYQTRHIVAQFSLAPGKSRTVTADLEPGAYRWRTRQRTERGDLYLAPAGARQTLAYRFTAEGVVGPAAPPTVAPGGELRFENAGGGELLLILEKADWTQDAVSAALVTSLQEFRNMFSSQVLAPGIGVSVRNLTVLFSDLKDSTVMYERVGDSPAYARVRDHFDIMAAAIAAHNGAIVKTIGDAVMAVFSLPSGAVAAALEIQAGIAAYNARVPPADILCVKLGLHAGPAIAINANDVLDYFGSTVNTAARVQGTSQGGDLVLTGVLFNDPAVRELLDGLPVEPFDAHLKGLSQQFTLYRVWPPSAPAGAAPVEAPVRA